MSDTDKWRRASQAARKSEHHWPADCLMEAADAMDALRVSIRRLADGLWDEEAEEWRHPDGYCDPDVWTIGNQEDSADIVSRVAMNNRARDLYALLGDAR